MCALPPRNMGLDSFDSVKPPSTLTICAVNLSGVYESSSKYTVGVIA
jgi:hypothetical protein